MKVKQQYSSIFFFFFNPTKDVSAPSETEQMKIIIISMINNLHLLPESIINDSKKILLFFITSIIEWHHSPIQSVSNTCQVLHLIIQWLPPPRTTPQYLHLTFVGSTLKRVPYKLSQINEN